MSEFEKGERQALLEVRSFITKHGTKEVDAYCRQRLHDIAMDARHQSKSSEDNVSNEAFGMKVLEHPDMPVGSFRIGYENEKVEISTKQKSK